MILHSGFAEYSLSPSFRKEVMDLALVGDAVILLYIRKINYNRLRFFDGGSKSEFDGRFKSNDLMMKYCKEFGLFQNLSGKPVADCFEAYLGWLYLNKMGIELADLLNHYFSWHVKSLKPGKFIFCCPLLRQTHPWLFN